MTVLVTGGSGFLGTALVRRLIAAGRQVVQVSRRPSTSPHTIQCDLSSPSAVVALLSRLEPACIVNLAAQVDLGPSRMADFYAINVLCPGLLANFAVEQGAQMVQASSISVHGTRHPRVGHATPEGPETNYGASKLLAEKLILASGCSATIVRFAGIFGRGGPLHLGINRAIDLAASGTPPLQRGDGRALRNYVYVEDAALMLERAIANRLEGVFFAGGEICSIRSMLDAICAEWLPGERPEEEEGSGSNDQIVECSAELGEPRSFSAALRDSR